jgi:hypothetical protein
MSASAAEDTPALHPVAKPKRVAAKVKDAAETMNNASGR